MFFMSFLSSFLLYATFIHIFPKQWISRIVWYYMKRLAGVLSPGLKGSEGLRVSIMAGVL